MEKENVCRTCLQMFKSSAFVNLNAAEDDSDSISLRQKLQACVPELTVDIVHEPVICETCCAAVILAYQFKSSCLDHEKILYKFIKHRKENPYDLLTSEDLLRIARKDIKEEHSYSSVERYYLKCSISDNDSDAEPEQLRLPATVQTSLKGIVKQALQDSSANVSTVVEEERSQVGATKKNDSKATTVKSTQALQDSSASVSSVVEEERSPAVAPKKNNSKATTIKSTRSKDKEINPIQLTEAEDLTSKSRPNRTKKSDVDTKKNEPKVKKVLPKKRKSGSDLKSTNKKPAASSAPSEKPVHDPNADSIENDLLEINQTIKKNNLQLNISKKVSLYMKHLDRYHCPKCTKSYNFRSHFDVHLKSHIFKKLYTCPICEKSFAQEKYLKAHGIVHTKLTSGLYQCDVCMKYLSASTALKRHYRIHTGEKPYKCTYCDKRFSQKIQLVVHTRIHTDLRLFTCNVCNTDFKQKSHLMAHIMTHTGEKPYKCDKCPRRFRKTHALQIHKNSHNLKPYQCKTCHFLIKDANTYQRHITRKACTNRRISKRTSIADKTLTDLEQDVQDINEAANLMEQNGNNGAKQRRRFSFRCTDCNRKYTSRFALNRHKKKIHA